MRSRGDFRAIYNDALRYYGEGKFAESVIHFRLALQFQPAYAEGHNNLGSALTQLGRLNEAVPHYERALKLKPNLADAHNNLAVVRMRQGRFEDAIVLYQRAIAVDPNQAEAHNNLGAILKEGGQFDDAMAHFNRAIAIRPDYADAHYNRAEVWVFRYGDAYLESLEELARKNLPANKAIYIHFALGKALEDCGDYARAFEHLCKGNAIKRGQIRWERGREFQVMQRISELFDSRLFDRLRGKGHSSQVPIFVLGMPRSGSTLIEQILVSHPGIQAGGELNSLESAAGVLSGGDGPTTPWPEYLPALDEPALQHIAESYIAGLPALADGRIRIVDKMPGNFWAVGLIRLVFPRARIIHTTRNPLDTCVSCYSKLFGDGHNYCYDMTDLGRYYRAYCGLMDHWRVILPPDALLDVAYEDVVDDLRGQAQRLIDYCGLPWDERCLSFHETARPVRTASAVQVRKPLFRTSLQRWRKYATALTPLLLELGSIAGDTNVRRVGA